MNCTYTNLIGIPEECDTNIGGINRIVLFSKKVDGAETIVSYFYDNLKLGAAGDAFEQAYMPNPVKTGNESSAEGLFGSAYNFEYVPQPNSSSVVSTQNIDNASGVNFTETVMTMSFSKEDITKYTAFTYLANMTDRNEVRGFYKDNNENWYYIGGFEPLTAYSGEITTGSNITDGQTITIALHDNGPYAPIPVLHNSYLETSLNTYFK